MVFQSEVKTCQNEHCFKKKHDFSILNDTKFEKDIHYEKGLAHLGIMTTKVRIFQQFPGSQNGPKTVPAAALPLVRVLHPTFAAVPMVELTNGTHVQLGEVLQHHLPEKHGQKAVVFSVFLEEKPNQYMLEVGILLLSSSKFRVCLLTHRFQNDDLEHKTCCGRQQCPSLSLHKIANP